MNKLRGTKKFRQKNTSLTSVTAGLTITTKLTTRRLQEKATSSPRIIFDESFCFCEQTKAHAGCMDGFQGRP